MTEMRFSRFQALGLALALGLAVTVSVRAQEAQEQQDGATVAQLQFRDRTVLITTGPLYTLIDADGAVLSRDLSDAELAAQHPELHQQVRTMFASEDENSLIWGGIFLE
ncbi:MAG: hypothetical protein AAFR42_08145 [Cyanobacteria bacterium J06628_6]